jgi:ATP-binding protein involved in chromosome partitioning
MFHKLEVPIVGIVENMAYFLCPCCGTRSDIFGSGGGRRLAERSALPFLGEIPLHQSVREAGDQGRSVLIERPDSPEAEAFRKLAGAVAARVSVLAFDRQQAARATAGVPIKFVGRRN